MNKHQFEHPSGPVSLETKIKFSGKLPEAVDVCIIGGGIIGISTALYLAEQNIRVLVCEKGRIAGEQSSRNWGWIRQQGRDTAELPLMMESNRIWQKLAGRCASNALKFNQQGIWYLAENETRLAEYDEFFTIAQQQGLDTRMLGRDEVNRHFSDNSGRWCGAMYTPSDGRAEPWVAVPALATAAEEAGAMIHEECAVRALEHQGGNLFGVITEHGLVKADQVVLAGGAWSSLFASNLGFRLPQLSVRACAARVGGMLPGFSGNAMDQELAFRRREDEDYNLALTDHHDHYVGLDSFRYSWNFRKALASSWRHTRLHPWAPRGFPDALSTARHWKADDITPFEKMRLLEPSPSQSMVKVMQKRLQRRFPKSNNIKIRKSWAGMIDATPDLVPIIDRAPETQGLWIATGFSGHGFGIGPVIGRIVADLLQGRDAGHDLSRFRFGRFSDNSPTVLGPTI